MPNVHCIVSGHNKTILNKQNKTETTKNQTTEKISECNCRKKDSCLLPSKYLTSSIVYQATVTRNDTKEEKTYVGHTEGEFKTRYNVHTSSFRNSRYKHATELSKYVWHLKESSVKYSIMENCEKV